MKNLTLQGKRFRTQEVAELGSMLRKFPTLESVEFSDEIRIHINIVIELVMIKSHWLDPMGTSDMAEDVVSRIHEKFAERILPRLWKHFQYTDDEIDYHQKHPDTAPPDIVRNVFSYLFRGFKNIGVATRQKLSRKNFIPLSNAEFILEGLQETRTLEEESFWGSEGSDASQVNSSEFTALLRDWFSQIRFRVLNVEEFHACIWLADSFLVKGEIGYADIWPFMHLPLARQIFLVDHVSLKMRMALYGFSQKYPPEDHFYEITSEIERVRFDSTLVEAVRQHLVP